MERRQSFLQTCVVLLAIAAFTVAVEAKKKRRRTQERHTEPTLWTYSVTAEYPHDSQAFTQGLQFDRVCDDDSKACYDVFWESTGLNGRSSIRQVELSTGKVRLIKDLDNAHFGEGSTRIGDYLYMLTWRTSTAFKFKASDLSLVGSFSSGLGDGWGLTTDGQYLIATESSEKLHFIDPATMKEVRTVTITDRGHPIKWVNEIEVVGDELWGNVWQTECIARINMTTGVVVGWIHMHGLRESIIRKNLEGAGSMDVLNGIAYDPATKRVFVTGKLWPRVFEIVPKPYESNPPTWTAVKHLCWPSGHALFG